MIAKEDRERYIERSIMVNMALLKKTWAEKAMTGAKLRVIRALLGVKGTYTRAELQRNFAIPTVIFSPDFSDPQVRQAMLTQGMNSVNNMFGTPQIGIKRVDFDTENNTLTLPIWIIRRTLRIQKLKMIIHRCRSRTLFLSRSQNQNPNQTDQWISSVPDAVRS